jgi:hypothetical protein
VVSYTLITALRRDLVGVTHDAFQPAHVSMWLAPGPLALKGFTAGLEPPEHQD